MTQRSLESFSEKNRLYVELLRDPDPEARDAALTETAGRLDDELAAEILRLLRHSRDVDFRLRLLENLSFELEAGPVDDADDDPEASVPASGHEGWLTIHQFDPRNFPPPGEPKRGTCPVFSGRGPAPRPLEKIPPFRPEERTPSLGEPEGEPLPIGFPPSPSAESAEWRFEPGKVEEVLLSEPREPEGRSPSEYLGFSPLSPSAGRGGQGGEDPLPPLFQNGSEWRFEPGKVEEVLLSEPREPEGRSPSEYLGFSPLSPSAGRGGQGGEGKGGRGPEIAGGLSRRVYGELRDFLRELFEDERESGRLRRKALEVAVLAPEPWHAAAVREGWLRLEPEWRVTALFCMGHLFPVDFAEEIAEGLASSENALRSQAISAADSRGLRALGPRILRLAADRGHHLEVRLCAIEALATLRPPGAAALLARLRAEPAPFGHFAADALACLEENERAEALLEDWKEGERRAPPPAAVAGAPRLADSRFL